MEVVSGGVNNGLGPRFNLNSCSGCHAQPAVGGSSPPNNPEFQVITQGIASGSTNTLPSFITAHGPTLEARFPFFTNSNGSPNRNAPNGGVEDIFTVSGRPDAGNCNLQQPNFQQALQTNNIIFRIPTPTFGAGLIENIDDSTLIANQQAQAANNFGIGGAFNRNGNDGTIARFGWKAQNKSLLLFAGEAYNVEMGITNEIFSQERPLPQEEQGERTARQLLESFGARLSRGCDQLQRGIELRSRRAERAGALGHRAVRGVHAAAGAAGALDEYSRRSAVDLEWVFAVQGDRLRNLPHSGHPLHSTFQHYGLAGQCTGESLLGF